MRTTIRKIGKVLVVLTLTSLVLSACAVTDQVGNGQTSGGNGNGAGIGEPFTASDMEGGEQLKEDVFGDEDLPNQGRQGWSQEEGLTGLGFNSTGQGSQGRGWGGSRGGQGGNQLAYGTGQSTNPLSPEEQDALQSAILEEYGTLNLYQSVIDQFGQVQPFTAIVRSEQQHVNALLRQTDKYGITAPVNPGILQPVAFATLEEACQAGVDAEIADAALYDDLMPVTEHTDLLKVYGSLQSASLENHLPAFEACQ